MPCYIDRHNPSYVAYKTNNSKGLTHMTTDDTSSLDDLLADPFGETKASDEPAVSTDRSLNEDTSHKRRAYDDLTDERKDKAQKLAKQLDVANTQGILDYGSGAQKQLGRFSQDLLTKVTVQDTGEIGDVLSELMYKLDEADPNELIAQDKNVFRKIFGKVKQSVREMSLKYQQIGTQIDGIAVKLESEKTMLIKDNAMLETLYEQNKQYFDILNIFIAAAELKIEDIMTVTLPEAIQKADASGSQMDVQAVNDINQFVDRLEKRAYDLQLARQISIQQAPQIRLIQNTNQALAEKIQSSINTAIPLWKNQVAISLTLLRQKGAVTAQRQVSQTTNDLMKKNSEMLKISTIEAAHENERGLIDIETLQQTQADLIDTLQETVQIQREGRIKRKEAEKELISMEDTLRQSLLEQITNE